jgi:hypothetical protein
MNAVELRDLLNGAIDPSYRIGEVDAIGLWSYRTPTPKAFHELPPRA